MRFLRKAENSFNLLVPIDIKNNDDIQTDIRWVLLRGNAKKELFQWNQFVLKAEMKGAVSLKHYKIISIFFKIVKFV